MPKTAPSNGADNETVELPPVPIRAYLRAHNIAAVCVTPAGVKLARDVGKVRERVTAAWWCQPADALKIAEYARLTNTADVPAIAQHLGVALTPHTRAVERAAAAVARINSALDQAKRDGLMSQFNESYRQARRQAAANGKGFMPYQTAQSRFARLIYDASAGKPTRGLIAQALGINESLKGS